MDRTKKILAPLLIASLALQACSSDEPRSTRLSVVGEAVIDTNPDTAIIVASVVTQSKTALDAQQENARRSAEIQKAVSALVGKTATVTSRGYSLSPQHRYDARSIPSIIGYEARNSVEIAVPSTDRVGEVVDAATKAGANSIESVRFERRNVAEAHSRALSEASKQAMAKAEAMAAALGAKITRVYEGVEVSGDVPPHPYTGGMLDGRATNAESVQSTTPLPPGTLRMQTAVRLIVEIERQEEKR